MSILRIVMVSVLCLCGLSAQQRTQAWPDEVVAAAERLPVQDGGRVKPLYTYASYLMLRVNGKRSLTVKIGEEEESLTPVTWLLDCIFYPEQARKYEVFLVPDSELILDLGLSIDDKRKKDRYSYDFLQAAEKLLADKADRYVSVPGKVRSSLQQQTVHVAQNYREMHWLFAYLRFATSRHTPPDFDELTKLYPAKKLLSTSVVIAKLPQALKLVREFRAKGKDDEARDIEAFLEQAYEEGLTGRSLSLVPPGKDLRLRNLKFQEDTKTWASPADLVNMVAGRHGDPDKMMAFLQPFERLVDQRSDQAAFAKEFVAFEASMRERADGNGDYEKVGLELHYLKTNYFFWAQVLFSLAFVLCMLQYLNGSRILYRVTWGMMVVPAAMVKGGIIIRCFVRGEPPVTNLYETIPFITAVAVLVGLVAEAITRKRIAQLVAVAFGAAGMFLARRYEVWDGRDTLDPLQAVLRTNFYLATHVTTVTMGYAASLLGAILAWIYLIGKLFDRRDQRKKLFTVVARCVYGCIAFGLLFSTFGTIYGGVWANDSWGRFWGWDPKENGALIIVLAQLMILHARMGGYIKQFGLCLWAQCLGMCVIFSWFHVNLLGVGLHSYGFNARLHTFVMSGYGTFGVMFLAGAVAWLLAQQRGKGEVATRADKVERPAEEQLAVEG